MASQLTLYRRHASTCPHRAKGQNYTKCTCPIWCDGDLEGRRFRKSVGVRDWARAVKRVEKWEASTGHAAKEHSVAGAIESYLWGCRARNLKETSIISYRKTLDHLKAFCEGRRIQYLSTLDLGALTDFRSGRVVPPRREDEKLRPISPATSAKELEALRTFCAFAVKRGWMEKNLAKELRPPREDGPPTMPFTGAEIDKILAACDAWGDRNPNTREFTKANVRAMVLVMLYSGLRISDAVQLRRDAVDLATGKMLLRIMKTGRKQYLRLGQPAVDALKALREKDEYFFWNGRSAIKTATGMAWRTISRLLARAGVKGHPHRFRDTFSVRLLEKGEQL